MIRTIVLALALALVVACDKSTPSAGSGSGYVNAPAIDEFRASERAVLATFNDALHRQKANQIDELGLADTIDRAVLPPWRELRMKIAAAQLPPADHDLHVVLIHYANAREAAWSAYATALRAPSDAAAQPHYAAYHQHEDEATDDARILGRAFRSLNGDGIR